MISCLFITNPAGKILVLRLFRGDVTKDDALVFCRNANQIMTPTYRYEKLNFFRVNMDGLNLVALTRKNGNTMLTFHTLVEMKKVLYSFFSGVINEENVLANASVIYELFDECIDGGYTQNMEPLVLGDVMTTKVEQANIMTDTLKLNLSRVGFLYKFGVDPESYLSNNETFKGRLNDSDECLEYSTEVATLMATSVIPPWRSLNSHTGRSSITVEMIENINILYNANSEIVTYEVTGSLVVNSQLSGTPLIHLRMNDDFFLTSNSTSHPAGPNGPLGRNYQTNASSSEFQLPVAAKQNVRLDDYKFHQCVNLESIRNNKTISFIPPDGMFVLLCYRSTYGATIPFIIRPKVKMIDSLHVNYAISLTPTFSKAIQAQKVYMRVPVPRDVREVVSGAISTGTTIEPNLSQHYVSWTFKKLQGETTYFASFTAILATNKLVQSNNFLPSMKLYFSLPWFSSSGLYISSLDCTNIKGKVGKTVNYTTKAGLYQHRLKFL